MIEPPPLSLFPTKVKKPDPALDSSFMENSISMSGQKLALGLSLEKAGIIPALKKFEESHQWIQLVRYDKLIRYATKKNYVKQRRCFPGIVWGKCAIIGMN